MSETTTLARPTRADQAKRILTTVRKGLSTATWLCDELLGVLERGASH
ncbi:hypothetical protein [Curtobacterium sp. MCBA15_004]|nr:hypothetical protein [Curtobacterium sp. MCBA15_004]WIA95784.1 hypothetical protein QOL16_11760 [Curtobacterium sp. MCBA15_004]